jgi:hypothetical protein
MFHLLDWFNKSQIISNTTDINKFSIWYSKTLLELCSKINPAIKIETAFHLLIFILNKGDVCYFTDIKDIQNDIITNRENANRTIPFIEKLNIDSCNTMKTLIPKEIIISLIKQVTLDYNKIIIQKKYPRNEGYHRFDELSHQYILNDIIGKINLVIIDDNIIDKKAEIKTLEEDYKLVKSIDITLNDNLDIVDHNYETFMSTMKHLLNECIDDHVFTPMEIVSSKMN